MAKKKFLLVSPAKPKTISQTSNKTVASVALFPVGLAYISSFMKKYGYSVYTFNAGLSDSDLASSMSELIRVNKIDIACIGGQSIDVHGIREVIGILRNIDPLITIILGGAIVSSDPETAMEVLHPDFGVIGEGEETMCELAHALETNAQTSSIPGIVYWENDTPRRAPARPEIQDLDKLPLMDFEGFSYREWLELNDGTGIIFTARSCPFQCTFCFKSTGRHYRSRSLDMVFDEIDFQIAHYGITTLNISDELFAANKNRVIDFCQRISSRQLHWTCSLRVPEITEELVLLMKSAGCTTIGTGLESASPGILASMRKNISAPQIEQALHIFDKTGMTLLGNFIFGDINETKETYRETLNFWRRYKDKLHINLGTIATLPGSHIYDYACSTGLITDKRQYLLNGDFFINLSSLSEPEYYEMLSEITELSFTAQAPARKVKIQSHDTNGICTIDWVCRRCGISHHGATTHFLQADIFPCTCGAQNTIEPFQDVIVQAEKITKHFSPEITYAFWGVGSQYIRLAQRLGDAFKGNHFVQIDSNRHHQKMTRLGHPVFSPEIIHDRGISDVIITSPTAKCSILGSLQTDFPEVVYIHLPKLDRIQDQYHCTFESVPISECHNKMPSC